MLTEGHHVLDVDLLGVVILVKHDLKALRPIKHVHHCGRVPHAVLVTRQARTLQLEYTETRTVVESIAKHGKDGHQEFEPKRFSYIVRCV